MNYESLRKYKVGIYIKFHHMLRGKIFEKKAKNHLGGGAESAPSDVTRVKVEHLSLCYHQRITLKFDKKI